MKQDEAKLRIIEEFRRWCDSRSMPRGEASGSDALVFYNAVQRNKPQLLAFSYSGDKWQRVHGWLLHAQLVKD